MNGQVCQVCGKSMAANVRKDAKYCGSRCKQQAFWMRQLALAEEQQDYVYKQLAQDNIASRQNAAKRELVQLSLDEQERLG